MPVSNVGNVGLGGALSSPTFASKARFSGKKAPDATTTQHVADASKQKKSGLFVTLSLIALGLLLVVPVAVIGIPLWILYKLIKAPFKLAGGLLNRGKS